MIPTTPTEIYYIREESQVGEALNHLLRFDMLGFDTETYHTRDRRKPAFDPVDGARIRLSQWATPEGHSFVFDHFHVSLSYLYMMFPNPFLLVGQNLKFDLKFLMFELGIDNFGQIFDTMIAGQLNNRGNVAGMDSIPVSMKHLAKQELDLDLDKEEQTSNWWMPELSPSQISYAGQDALIPLALYEKQVQKLRRDAQVRVAEIDFGCVPAVAQMELNGMRLDGEKWAIQHQQSTQKLQSIREQLWDYFGTQGGLFEGAPGGINLDSSPQMITAFRRKGLPVPQDSKTGNDSLNGNLLTMYEAQYPIISKYKEYKGYKKFLSSYGLNWLDFINPLDGRIHADYKIIGAETGRMSANHPNMLQIPRDEDYRNCFIPAPGWVIVSADYSQMELRILAEFCRDENLLLAFDRGYDLHRFSAHLIFQVVMEIVTKVQRGIAKNLNFGIVYGIGVLKFARQAGISIKEAEKIMRYYLYEAYPNMRVWLNNQATNVVATMKSYTMTGRIREYFGDIKIDGVRAGIERNGKNFPIQGTSADITKRAAHLVYLALRNYRNKIKLINIVHDEILLEARPEYVESAQRILEDSMLKAEREYLKRVPSVVDGAVTLCWTKEATDNQLAEARRYLQGVKQV